MNEFDLDLSALMELGNIGASHSATALSEMIGKKVSLTSPQPITEGEIKPPYICVLSNLLGIKGVLIFAFPLPSALKIAEYMLKVNIGGELSEFHIPPLQQVSKSMADAFVNALGEFFGKELDCTVPLHVEDNVDSLIGGAEAFKIEVKTDEELICYLIFALTKEGVESIMESEVPEFEEYGSFGEMVSSFEKLFDMESRIEGFILNKVPLKEIRRFLRAITPDKFENNRLKRYLENALEYTGIGSKISLHRIEPLKYHLKVEECNVCRDLPNSGKKSCFTTNTALGRFFRENLGIDNEVIEIKCIKAGDDACIHEISLERIDVLSCFYEPKDIEILKAISNGQNVEMDAESVGVLEYYGLLKDNQITDLGKVFLTFVENATPRKEEDIEGWDDLNKIDSSKDVEETPPWQI